MSIDYICEDAFDIQKIGYSVEGQILYEEKFLQRRFEGTYEKKINGVVCFIIEDSKWIAIHNSIVKKLKSANVTYCNLYEKFCSSESANLFLGCKANFDHFPFHDSDLKEGCKITGIIKYDRSHCTQYVATLCLYECHKYEYPKTYSWGELYETLKDMEEKGDWVEDPLFRRILNLFPRLENAPFTEVQRILRTEPFTETELNRINSPCLDGLIACVPFHLTDMKKIYENSYTETYKFCLDKGMPLDNFSSILVEYGNKPILQIYLDRGGKIPHPQAFGRYANVSLFYYYIKHGVNLSVELCQFLVDNGAETFDNNIFTALLTRDFPTTEQTYLEIVKFFLEKGLIPDEICLFNFIQHHRYDIAKILIQYGARINFDIKQVICAKNLADLFEASFQNDKTWNSSQLNIACKYGSFETVRKMIQAGIKGDIYTLGQTCIQEFQYIDTREIDLRLVKFLLENGYDTLSTGAYRPNMLNFLLENNIKIDDNFIRSVCLTREESLIWKLIEKKVCIDEILTYMLPNASLIKKLVETQLRKKYNFVEKKN